MGKEAQLIFLSQRKVGKISSVTVLQEVKLAVRT